jgi:hypothetical protein
VQFADATIQAAADTFDEEAAEVVRKVWQQVGITTRKATTSKWGDCLSGLQ